MKKTKLKEASLFPLMLAPFFSTLVGMRQGKKEKPTFSKFSTLVGIYINKKGPTRAKPKGSESESCFRAMYFFFFLRIEPCISDFNIWSKNK